MEDIPADSYRRLLDMYIKTLRYTGVWPLLPSAKMPWKALNVIYHFINYSIIFLALTTMCIDALHNATDLTIIGMDGCFIFGLAMIYLKVWNFTVSYDDILKLIDDVYDPISIFSRSSDRGILMIIKKCILQERMEISLLCVSYLTMGLAVILLVPREKGVLPIRAFYPFNTSVSPYYELTLLWQSYVMGYCLVVLLAADAVTVGFIRWTTIQVKVLTSNFKNCNVNLARRAQLVPSLSAKTLNLIRKFDSLEIIDEELKINKFIEFQYDSFNNIVNDSFFLRYKTCIKQHQKFIQVIYNLNAMLSSSILVQFVSSTAIICLNGFQMILNSTDTTNFVKFASYWVSCFGQLLFWCYYGNQFTNMASTLTRNQWMSGWENFFVQGNHNELGNLITTSMIQTMRPLEFKAIGLFGLSIPTFVSIFKSSYSILVLLTTVTGA